MRKKRLVSAVLLVLLLAGCGQTGGKLLPSGTGRTDTAAAQAELDVQLGLLKDEITAEERREALDLWSKIRAIQTERKAKGNYERSDYEWRLLRRLSGLYDAYTIRYLGGDEEGFGCRRAPLRALTSSPSLPTVRRRQWPMSGRWMMLERAGRSLWTLRTRRIGSTL